MNWQKKPKENILAKRKLLKIIQTTTTNLVDKVDQINTMKNRPSCEKLWRLKSEKVKNKFNLQSY